MHTKSHMYTSVQMVPNNCTDISSQQLVCQDITPVYVEALLYVKTVSPYGYLTHHTRSEV